MTTASLLRTSLGLLAISLSGSLLSVDARRITASPVTAFVSSHQFASSARSPPVASESPSSTSPRIQQRQRQLLQRKQQNLADTATPPEPPPMEEFTGAGTTVSDLVDTSGTAFSIPELPIYQLALAGSFTTFFTDVIMHPMDCIKTVQQSDSGVGLSLFLAAQYLWSTSGMAGFYHGFLTYALSDAVGGALKFSVWELWKKKTAEWEPTYLYLWIGAALAFAASSILVVPGEVRCTVHCSACIMFHRFAQSVVGGFGVFCMHFKRNWHSVV
jgi:hypothetical protein